MPAPGLYSDTLYCVFSYRAATFLSWLWIARRTSDSCKRDFKPTHRLRDGVICGGAAIEPRKRKQMSAV